MSKKIGIVIPSYNQGKYIETTIQSVLKNKKHVDLAVALIDGGSQDETLAIVEMYKEHLDVFCSEPDGGQANAINKGIRLLPKCEYYMWLNSDDVFEDEYAVKKIVAYAQDHHYEVCYGLSHFIDDSGNTIGEYPVEEFCNKKLGRRCFLSQPSVIFSGRAYEKVGPINEQLKMCLDYEYWIRLSKEYAFGFIKEYIGSTRMYGETKTSTMQQRHLNEAIRILMKYYGKVPMRWIIAKVLADKPGGLLQYIPGHVLMILLIPIKKKVISESVHSQNID